MTIYLAWQETNKRHYFVLLTLPTELAFNQIMTASMMYCQNTRYISPHTETLHGKNQRCGCIRTCIDSINSLFVSLRNINAGKLEMKRECLNPRAGGSPPRDNHSPVVHSTAVPEVIERFEQELFEFLAISKGLMVVLLLLLPFILRISQWQICLRCPTSAKLACKRAIQINQPKAPKRSRGGTEPAMPSHLRSSSL